MDYKRNQQRGSDSSGPQARTTQSSYKSYSSFQHPIERKSSLAPMMIFGAATLLPIAAVIYYFSKSEMNHPIVEREDTPVSDFVSQPDEQPARQVVSADLAENSVDPATAGNPAPNSLEQERDQRMHEQVRALKEALARADIQKQRQAAKENAGTQWKVENFDPAAQQILSKNTKLWSQMAARDLDAEEIALAKRSMGVFSGTAGDIYAGMNTNTSVNAARAPSSVNKMCRRMRPRSPDKECRANYPCRICGACCCMCEAFLAGLTSSAHN